MATPSECRGREEDSNSGAGQNRGNNNGAGKIPIRWGSLLQSPQRSAILTPSDESESGSDSDSDQESNARGTFRSQGGYPSIPHPPRPVIFTLGDDSGTNSSDNLSKDNISSNASDLFDHLDDSPGLRRTHSLGPWAHTQARNTHCPRQLTRAFLRRRMSEGGGECIRESWRLFKEEDLINTHFRHAAGIRPSSTNSLDGAWNDDLDSGINARFRQSGDAPFLTREAWLRRQLAWPRRSGSGDRRSSLASAAGPTEEVDEWIWCETIPDTFEDEEWDLEGVRPEQEDGVEEGSLPQVARTLFTQACRRLTRD